MMPVTDLNAGARRPQPLPGKRGLRSTAHVYRQTRLLPGHRADATAHLPPLCAALPGRAQGQVVQLPRPISVHGLRPTHLPRKSTRYRSLPSCPEKQTLSHGHSGQSITQHLGLRQREKRLAYLCRLFSISYSNRTQTLYRRRFGRRSRQYGICTRRLNHRPLPFRFPMGSVPYYQSSSKTTYSARSSRQYPKLHPYFRRQTSRGKRSRSPYSRARFFLHHGPGLSGLRTVISSHPSISFFRYSSQIESQVSKALFRHYRQERRFETRSNWSSHRFLYLPTVSGQVTENKILRSSNRQTSCLFNQQLFTTSSDYCRVVPFPLAGRTVFQMDQTASSNQGFLWNFGERGKKPDMDCRIDLCARCNHQKETENRCQSLHNSTGFEPVVIRENAHFRGVC